MAEPASILSDISEGLADAVAPAAASTVTVSARRRFPASGVVWTADGVIVTADHVIEREENITVTLPDGREVTAVIAGRDAGSDIAVLRAQAGDLTPIARGQAARVGHLVLAVGRPAPGEPMASFGVVGAVGGPWRTFRGATVEGYLRSDAAFYPGFSGGPLVDTAGQMVGLNSSRLGRGAGMTIPVAAVATVVEALLAGGRIRRGYLGVGTQAVRLPAASSQAAGGQETGLLVVGVEPGSPADTGGILLGDVLVAMQGQPLTDTDDLHQQLGGASVGTTAAIRVIRGGELRELSVVVGERPQG